MIIPITPKGFVKFQQQLDKLVAEYDETLERVKEALGLGDLKENAEYHAAKERQSVLQEQLSKTESLMNQLYVVNPKAFHDRIPKTIEYGALITLKDLKSGKEKNHLIVSIYEEEFFNNSLSTSSTLGGLLMHKKIGEVVAIEELKYQIVDIAY